MAINYSFWDYVFNENYKQLYTYTYTLVHNREVANDLVSDTFITLMLRDKYKDCDNMYPALKNTLDNLFKERARKEKKEKMSFEEFYMLYYEDSIADIEEIICQSEQEAEVEKALETLHEGDRHIIFLRYFQLLLFVQISVVLNVKYTTVLYRHQRALSELYFYFTGTYSHPTHKSKRPKSMFFMYLSYIFYLLRRCL